MDIAKAKFDVARLADGKYRHNAFDNTPEGFALFAEWLAGFGDASPAVCMEATGAYSVPLAECLAAQGFRVSVVNPAKIAAFVKSELSRAKTDKADAKRIARYCAVMRPPAWTPPPREIRALQALRRRVEHLLEMEQYGEKPPGHRRPHHHRIVQSRARHPGARTQNHPRHHPPAHRR